MDGMESKQLVRIGDVVKSLDFVGDNGCYYVGIVTDINALDSTFKANTIKRVWNYEMVSEVHTSLTFVAPLPFTLLSDEKAEQRGLAPRVQVLA